ncbi:hypothetical protein GCM10010398_65770 [Streptomyces fimbriatus]
MAESFGGDTPITGSVTVSPAGGRTSKGAPLPADPAAVAARLAVKEAKKAGDSWRKATTVDLPGVGPAARTYGVEDIPVPGDELNRTVRDVPMQTFIPVPGQEGRAALVAGSSQVLDLADSFFDIVDAITSTFRFVGRGPWRPRGAGRAATACRAPTTPPGRTPRSSAANGLSVRR